MTPEHRASITWSQQLMDEGLPTVRELTNPAWIDPDAPGDHDGWSLACRFERAPSELGNPSAATVRMVAADAPHDRVKAGVTLRLFEPTTKQYASVAIVD